MQLFLKMSNFSWQDVCGWCIPFVLLLLDRLFRVNIQIAILPDILYSWFIAHENCVWEYFATVTGRYLLILQLNLPFSLVSTPCLFPQSLSLRPAWCVNRWHFWPSNSWQSHCDLTLVLIGRTRLTWDQLQLAVLNAALSMAWIRKK